MRQPKRVPRLYRYIHIPTTASLESTSNIRQYYSPDLLETPDPVCRCGVWHQLSVVGNLQISLQMRSSTLHEERQN